jgi:hypothetical protein
LIVNNALTIILLALYFIFISDNMITNYV